MTTVPATRLQARAQRSLLDRVLSAFPGFVLALTVFVLYAVEAWSRKTPWIFSDELEWTQLSRSIAATGHAARRTQPTYFKSVYAYLIAPDLVVDQLDPGRLLGDQVRERGADAARGDPDLPARADARLAAERGRGRPSSRSRFRRWRTSPRSSRR